jgi:hypothetical protein
MCQLLGLSLARGRLGGRDVLGSLDQRDEDVDVLGGADLGPLLAFRPDRLHCHAVGEN